MCPTQRYGASADSRLAIELEDRALQRESAAKYYGRPATGTLSEMAPQAFGQQPVAFAAFILVHDLGAKNIRGHQIRCELNTAGGKAKNGGKGSNEFGLGKTDAYEATIEMMENFENTQFNRSSFDEQMAKLKTLIGA